MKWENAVAWLERYDRKRWAAHHKEKRIKKRLKDDPALIGMYKNLIRR